MKGKKYLLICVLVLIVTVISGCTTKRVITNTITGFYFDTVVSVRIDTNRPLSSEIKTQLNELLAKYDNMLSKTIEGSDVYRINSSEGVPVEVSEETFELIEKALYYEEVSKGKFSCTVGALTEIWDYKSENPKVPQQKAIENALTTIGKNNVVLDKAASSVMVKNGAKLDLGGIAKGYVADKIREYLEQDGIIGGIINLGGNVIVFGNSDAVSDYKIGIQKPFSESGEVATSLKRKNASIVTSGSYQRYFTDNTGKQYHHILDTATGYPAETDLDSVTIISESSMDGDALSTICFIMGKKEAESFVEELPGVEAVFIEKSGKISATSGAGIEIK